MQGLSDRLHEVICSYCQETGNARCRPNASCPGTVTGQMALLGYCGSLGRERDHPEHRTDPRIEKVLTFLEENWHTQIRVRDLAKRSALSQSHFRSLFAQVTRVSLRQYLTLRRLKEAALLLQNTDLSVADICFQVGWSDLSNFNRAFKRHFQICPKDFCRARPCNDLGSCKLPASDAGTDRGRSASDLQVR